MTSELAVQKAVRTRLVATSAVTSLVPAASILDRNQRPAPDPAIIIGEGQAVDEGNSIARNRVRVWLDLHVWKREPSTEGVKTIAGAIRNAVASARFETSEGFHFADCAVSRTRYLRDPDGEHSHAVVTVEAVVQEVA